MNWGGKGGGKGKSGKVTLIDRVDGGGTTPLCAAVCAHEHECVRLLLDHHARLLARDASPNPNPDPGPDH